MSRMIPQETIDTLRQQNDISIDLYGIECKLRVPINLNRIQSMDVYSKPSDYDYKEYNTLVFIEWKADEKRLRKLGIFVEGEIPIIAWFKHEIPVTIGSYFKIPIQYIPKEYSDTDEFEVIDVVIRGMHDAIIINAFKVAPRRVKK